MLGSVLKEKEENVKIYYYFLQVKIERKANGIYKQNRHKAGF